MLSPMRVHAWGALWLIVACDRGLPPQPPPVQEPAASSAIAVDPPPSARPPEVASEPPVAATPPRLSSDLRVRARPLAEKVRVGEAFDLALHCERNPDGKILDTDIVDWQKTFADLSFSFESAKGKSVQRGLNMKSAVGRRAARLSYAPTLLLRVSATGVRETSGFEGAWEPNAPEVLAGAGPLSIRISGRIHFESGAEHAFASEPISLKREPNLPFHRTFVARATAEAKKRGIAAGQLSSQPLDGFVPDLVVESSPGRRRVALAFDPSRWTYRLLKVELDERANVLRSSVKNIKTCVAYGVPVEAERGIVPIETIDIGERVWGYDIKRRRRILTRVREARHAMAPRTLAIDGLGVTPHHPLFVNGAWRSARDVLPGSTLLSTAGRSRSVTSVQVVDVPTAVVDLSVEAPHNYFAGGVLVHNKDRAYRPGLDDPWFFLWESP